MATLVVRKDKYYAQCNIQVPLDLKTKVDELGVNLTQAAIAGIEAEVEKIEKEKGG
jgi:post-segregation antitoxin (ccd killing protein)